MKRLLFLLILAVPIAAHSQALLPYVEGGFFDNNGNPLSAGKICTTVSGSSVTNLATYPTFADAVALTNANPNPVVLDSAGRGSIWLPGGVAYRISIYANGTGGTCNGSAVGTVIKTVDGVSAFPLNITALTITARTINNVQYCNAYPGANASAKITACIAALPSTGGTADARGIQGAQSWTTCPVTGVTKPVMLLLGAATHSVAVSCDFPSAVDVVFDQGGIISMATATTANILGTVGGSVSQHFTGAGNVVVTNSLAPKPNVEWWGVTCDNATDNAAAIARAMVGSNRLKWGPGVCLTNTGIFLTGPGNAQSAYGVEWEAANVDNLVGQPSLSNPLTSGTTTIRANAAMTSLFKVRVVRGNITGFVFDGNQLATNVLQLVPSSNYITFTHDTFTSPIITTGRAVFLDGFNGGGTPLDISYNVFTQCTIAGADLTHKSGFGVFIQGSNTFKNSIRDSLIWMAATLVKLDHALGSSGGIDISGTQFEYWTAAANYIEGPIQQSSWINNYTETTSLPFFDGSNGYAATVGYKPVIMEQNQMNAINVAWIIYAGQPYIIRNNNFSYNVNIEQTSDADYIPPITGGNTFNGSFDFTSSTGRIGQLTEIENYLQAGGSKLAVRRTTLKDIIGIGRTNADSSKRVTVDAEAFTAAASTDMSRVQITGTSAVTIPAGTTPNVQTLNVDEPNLTCTGTCQNASTVRISGAPTEGTVSNQSLWVVSGATRLGGTVTVATFTGATASHVCYDASSLPAINMLATCTSLEEQKDIAGPLDSDTALTEVMALNPIAFKFHQEPGDGPNQYGLGARAVNAVDPRLSSYYEGKLNGVNFDAVVALLLKTVQAQQRSIEAMVERLMELEKH